MENVNKIQIRLDSIRSSATTINIPFGLDFFPVDNTELQEDKFVKKEIEKSINPIFDHEKYPFYPIFPDQINYAYTVRYVILNQTLSFLGLTDDDIKFKRNPFKRTYLRLNFYDSRDTKTQRLVARETLHLKVEDNWFTNGKLNNQSTIPLVFFSNKQNLIYNSINGEGFNFYWYKNSLPIQLYMKVSLMNAKTGEVINLYSSDPTNPVSSLPNSPSIPIQVVSRGLNYVETTFFEDVLKRNQYFYIFNNDNISDIQYVFGTVSLLDNTITVNLNTY